MAISGWVVHTECGIFWCSVFCDKLKEKEGQEEKSYDVDKYK